MSYPKGVQLGLGGALFVSDIFNNRIIMYPPTPPSSPFGISAVDVFGQSTFTSISYGSAPDQLNSPYLIAYDDKYGCLWVTDQGNNRIVKYCNITMPAVQNNISSNGVSMEFSGRSPSVTLTPTSSSPAPGTILLVCQKPDWFYSLQEPTTTTPSSFIQQASKRSLPMEASSNRSPSLKRVIPFPHPSIPNRTNTSNSSPPWLQNRWGYP